MERNCSHPLGFDDNKVLKEKLGILTYVQVCRIINLKFHSKLTLMKAYVEKINDSDSEGSKYDESKCVISAFEGSKSDYGIPAYGDNSDSEDLI